MQSGSRQHFEHPLKIIIVRHGERVDSVDNSWITRAARKFDPELTPIGHQQAAATGRLLRRHLDLDNKRADEVHLEVFSSPFIRCMQTAAGIVRELQTHDLRPTITIEHGLAEWHSRGFYANLGGVHGRPLIGSREEALDALAQAGGQSELFNEEPSNWTPVIWPEKYEGRVYRHGRTAVHFIKKPSPRPVATVRILVTHGYNVMDMSAKLGVKVEKPDYCCVMEFVYRQRSNRFEPGELIEYTDHWTSIFS